MADVQYSLCQAGASERGGGGGGLASGGGGGRDADSGGGRRMLSIVEYLRKPFLAKDDKHFVLQPIYPIVLPL